MSRARKVSKINQGFSGDLEEDNGIQKVRSPDQYVQFPTPVSNLKTESGPQALLLVTASFTMTLLQSGMADSFHLLIPGLQDHYNIDSTEASLTSSILTLTSLFMSPVASICLHHFSHKATITMGALLSSLGLVMGGLYSLLVPGNTASILVLYLTVGGVTGLGHSLMYLPAVDILTYYFQHRLGLAIGLAVAGSPIGQVLVAPVLFMFTSTLDLGPALCLLSSLGVLAILPIMMYRIVGDLEENQESKISSSRFKNAVMSPQVLILSTACFLILLGVFATLFYLPERNTLLGFEKDKNILFFRIVGVANCIGRIIFGILLDAFQDRVILLTAGVTIINAISVISSSFLHSMMTQAIFYAVFGFTWGAFITGIIIILSGIDRNISVPFSMCLLSIGISSFVSPPLAGFLHDISGTFTIGFLTTGGLGVIGSIILLLMLLPFKKQYITPLRKSHYNKECYICSLKIDKPASGHTSQASYLT